MPAYADVSVVVDGALEEEHRFTDEALMTDYIRTVQDEAEGHGYRTEVFILEHDHEPAECECIQYVQDHKPAYTFNAN
jgi:hypothetical protein